MPCCALSTSAEPPKTAADRMPALIEQFSADREALAAAYTVRVSPVRLERMKKFLGDEQAVLQATDFDSLPEPDKLEDSDGPQNAVEFDASPEGHALRFDRNGQLIGVTIVRPRWLLEHEGEITITIPEQVHLDPAQLGDALAAA